jgi:hypothetical protein
MSPIFDPQNISHRTVQEWAQYGPTANWWVNAVTAAVRRGESRVLLRAGNVLVIRYRGEGPLTVEEVPPW